MSDTVIVYQGDADWSAVYLNGKLERVGDHYLADEWIREHFGVQTVQSNDFLRGGNGRADVAPTLDDLDAYSIDRASRQERAEELRRQAAELEAEANRLEDADV